MELLLSTLVPEPLELRRFFFQWLMGMAAGVRGESWGGYMLILSGPPAIGKSFFFANLLPVELQEYYAESELNSDAGDYILMTEKMLIVNNEVHRMTNRAFSLLKENLGKNVFTIRYMYPLTPRMENKKRLAILGGTTNVELTLNDPGEQKRIFIVNLESINHEIYNSIDKTALFMEILYRYDNL